MKHTSVKLQSPIEFVDIKPLNPLISKCNIKVCYVDDKPNRNRSVITKETAKSIANSLPGCPIVGFYNDITNDFEEHNRTIDISNGRFEINDTTKPYGFVDLNAKVWFQKFLDDGAVEREYLMTEGYLWTGQYPECNRIITIGNNQSMELDEQTLDATWSFDKNGEPEFFIINEAIISKLCILGEDCEPCFEGATITNVQFSFDDGFKQQLFSMMTELKELLQKGGTEQMFKTYAVEIGDTVWNAIYSFVEEKQYVSIEAVLEDEERKFAVIKDSEDKIYSLDFSIEEDGSIKIAEEAKELKDYSLSEEPQFLIADVEAFQAEYAKKKKLAKDDEEKDKNCQDTSSENKDNTEDETSDEGEDPEEKKKKKKKNEEDFACGGGKKKKKYSAESSEISYSLEEIPEYVELVTKFAQLEKDFSEMKIEKTELEKQIASLSEFKNSAERKEKETMIASFYMLSDEDKADVLSNIDKYSLDEIEAKLSILCVRNKVNFSLEDEQELKGATTFNLHDTGAETMPAWVKAAMNVAKTLE